MRPSRPFALEPPTRQGQWRSQLSRKAMPTGCPTTRRTARSSAGTKNRRFLTSGPGSIDRQPPFGSGWNLSLPPANDISANSYAFMPTFNGSPIHNGLQCASTPSAKVWRSWETCPWASACIARMSGANRTSSISSAQSVRRRRRPSRQTRSRKDGARIGASRFIIGSAWVRTILRGGEGACG